MPIIQVTEDMPAETREYYFLLDMFLRANYNPNCLVLNTLHIGRTKAKEEIGVKKFLESYPAIPWTSIMLNSAKNYEDKTIRANQVLDYHVLGDPSSIDMYQTLEGLNSFLLKKSNGGFTSSYDIISINDVNEKNPKSVQNICEQAFRNLRHGGVLFLTNAAVPNKNIFMEVLNNFPPSVREEDLFGTDVYRASGLEIAIWKK